MKVWQAVLLGLVQGITEFLPVSSSGHLYLTARLLGLENNFLFLAVVMHAGTLAAVLVVFFKSVCSLFRPPFKRLGILIAATIPAAVFGFLFSDALDAAINKFTLGFAFLMTAALLIAAERFGKKFDGKRTVDLKTGLAMGGMQCLALFPGISRSGSTITGGLLCRTARQDVAEFSFLMSVPVIAGAMLLQAINPAPVSSADILPLTAGFLTAFASGLAAAKFFLKAVKKLNFKWFAFYLAAIAVFTIVFM